MMWRVLGGEQRPLARAVPVEGRQHRLLDRRVVLLDLDVERHAGMRVEQLVERRDADAAARGTGTCRRRRKR